MSISQKAPVFHRGEVEAQKRAGYPDFAENIRKAGYVRAFMPDQHREFFESLPMTALAALDQNGRPWVTMLLNLDRTTHSPTPELLGFSRLPLLSQELNLRIEPGSKIGLCGVELETRRRNRMNGTVIDHDNTAFTIKVDQSYGNCPQYIQKREISLRPECVNVEVAIEHTGTISADAKTLIEAADTFFIASRAPSITDDPRSGVDASHRGGKPGFVNVSDQTTLSFPDYSGNRFFNTIGNLEIDGRVGLLFPDFASGDVVLITGRANVVWDDKRIAAFDGAERFIDITVEQVVLAKQLLPITGKLIESWPVLANTGSWAQMEINLLKVNGYREFKLTRKEIESDTIMSLYLEPADGGALELFKAGQYIPIRLGSTKDNEPIDRHYTLSNTPNQKYYRISVKREIDGQASNALHDSPILSTLGVGSPAGDFVIPDNQRDIVMISAGVGITPMIAMLENLIENIESCKSSAQTPKQVWFFQAARNIQEQAFTRKLIELNNAHDWLHVYFNYSEPVKSTVLEKAKLYYQSGKRLAVSSLSEILPFAAYDFFLCGPDKFMQSIYTGLRDIGIQRRYIHYEFFGEGMLIHENDIDQSIQLPNQATVEFAKTNIEEQWQKQDGSLLKFSESLGLTPKNNCRSGKCGTCSVRLIEGNVFYPVKPVIKPADGHALICCSYPAKDSRLILDI